MLALCHEDTTDLTARWSGACADVDLPFEDSRDKSVQSPAPHGRDCVLGTALDLCFCSQCVSNAFMLDCAEREQREQMICRKLDAGWCTETAVAGLGVDALTSAYQLGAGGCTETAVAGPGVDALTSACQLGAGSCTETAATEPGVRASTSAYQLDAGWCTGTAVAGPGVGASTLAAAGVPTSPCGTQTPRSKPTRGAPVPHDGVALASGSRKSSAELHMKKLERKKKNQVHARMSRIRQQEKLAAIKQRTAELEAECARLRAALQTQEHEQKRLKAELLADVLLC